MLLENFIVSSSLQVECRDAKMRDISLSSFTRESIAKLPIYARPTFYSLSVADTAKPPRRDAPEQATRLCPDGSAVMGTVDRKLPYASTSYVNESEVFLARLKVLTFGLGAAERRWRSGQWI